MIYKVNNITNFSKLTNFVSFNVEKEYTFKILAKSFGSIQAIKSLLFSSGIKFGTLQYLISLLDSFVSLEEH